MPDRIKREVHTLNGDASELDLRYHHPKEDAVTGKQRTATVPGVDGRVGLQEGSTAIHARRRHDTDGD